MVQIKWKITHKAFSNKDKVTDLTPKLITLFGFDRQELHVSRCIPEQCRQKLSWGTKQNKEQNSPVHPVFRWPWGRRGISMPLTNHWRIRRQKLVVSRTNFSGNILYLKEVWFQKNYKDTFSWLSLLSWDFRSWI